MRNLLEIEGILHSAYGDTSYTRPLNIEIAKQIHHYMIAYKDFEGTRDDRLRKYVTNIIWNTYSGGDTAARTANKILEGFFE